MPQRSRDLPQTTGFHSLAPAGAWPDLPGRTFSYRRGNASSPPADSERNSVTFACGGEGLVVAPVCPALLAAAARARSPSASCDLNASCSAARSASRKRIRPSSVLSMFRSVKMCFSPLAPPPGSGNDHWGVHSWSFEEGDPAPALLDWPRLQAPVIERSAGLDAHGIRPRESGLRWLPRHGERSSGAAFPNRPADSSICRAVTPSHHAGGRGRGAVSEGAARLFGSGVPVAARRGRAAPVPPRPAVFDDRLRLCRCGREDGEGRGCLPTGRHGLLLRRGHPCIDSRQAVEPRLGQGPRAGFRTSRRCDSPLRTRLSVELRLGRRVHAETGHSKSRHARVSAQSANSPAAPRAISGRRPGRHPLDRRCGL